MRTNRKKIKISLLLFAFLVPLMLTMGLAHVVKAETTDDPPVGTGENGILLMQWTYDMQSLYGTVLFGSSAAIADMGVNTIGSEPDADLEIVTGSDEYYNYYPELGTWANGIWRMFDSQGNLEWAKNTGTDESRSSPNIVDMDGDDYLEIVGGTTSGWNVEVMDRYGNFIWTFPWPPTPGGPFMWHSSPAVAEVDPSVSGLEVFIGNNPYGNVWALDGDNTDGANDGITATDGWIYGTEGTDWDVLWKYDTGASVLASPAVGDIDNDGQMEVVIGSGNGNLYVFDGITGTLEWSYTTGGDVHSSAAIADLDGDGYLEIVVGSADGNVYCLQWDGSLGTVEWSYTTGGAVYSSPAIGDVDADGLYEIVVGSDNGNVYGISPSGVMEWSYSTGGAVRSSAALANRGTVGLGVYIGSNDDYLYLLDGITGSLIDRFRTYGNLYTSPSVADVDGDGKLEIFLYDEASIYHFWAIEDTGSSVPIHSIEWQMFRHDSERTGTYPEVVPVEDTTPPITTKSLTGTLLDCGWYVSDVTVTLTATDDISGVNKTEYSFDEVTWIEYTGPFTITNEGITTIYYNSTDNAGNVEATKSQTIKIDKTAPAITIASPEAKNYTQAETLTLDFDATDTVSGIASTTALLSPDPPIIYLDPQISTAAVGETFSIDARIADAVDVIAWQIKLKWNPAILNVVTATDGDFLSSVGPTWYGFDIDQEEGWIWLGCVILSPWPPASGNGTLATITFKSIAPGETILDMIDPQTSIFVLFDSDWMEILPEVVNGYFTSVLPPEEHDIAVTSLAVSTNKVTSGDPVTVTVVVENQGTRTETFDVTVFYDSNVIATLTQISLVMGATETLTFSWNTAGVGLGSYLIKAEATVVPGEVETVDNTFINGVVMVRIPVYSGQTFDLSTFEVGTYTLTVTAIDNACNEASSSVIFKVQPPPGSISGMVFDEYTKEPIAGVNITLLDTGAFVITDGQGKYNFTDLMPRSYTVEMTVPYAYLTHDAVTKFVDVLPRQDTIVNFTLYQASWANATIPRTIGYWKNWKNHYTAEMMATFVEHVKSASGLFSNLTVGDVKTYLKITRFSTMDEKGQVQLLASWLNVVSAQLGVDVKVDLSSIEGWETVITIPEGSILTVDELLKQIDNFYLTDADLTKEEWEKIKDILDALNNGQLFLEE